MSLDKFSHLFQSVGCTEDTIPYNDFENHIFKITAISTIDK